MKTIWISCQQNKQKYFLALFIFWNPTPKNVFLIFFLVRGWCIWYFGWCIWYLGSCIWDLRWCTWWKKKRTWWHLSDFSFDELYHGVKNSISLSVSRGVGLVGDILPNCIIFLFTPPLALCLHRFPLYVSAATFTSRYCSMHAASCSSWSKLFATMNISLKKYCRFLEICFLPWISLSPLVSRMSSKSFELSMKFMKVIARNILPVVLFSN